jgi:hypothetical protein
MKLKKCRVGMKVVFNNFGPLVISCINKRTVNLRIRLYLLYVCRAKTLEKDEGLR